MSGGINAIGNLLGKVDASNNLCVSIGGITAGTFADLPLVPVEGMIRTVSDANTAVWGASVTTTGANHVLVWYNGSAWSVIGK